MKKTKTKTRERGQAELPCRSEGHGHLEVEIQVCHGAPHLIVAWLHSLSLTVFLTDPLSSEWVREGRKLAWSPEVSRCGVA